MGDRVSPLSECCDPTPYRRFFNRKEAERTFRRYRRKGLDSMAASMMGFLKAQGMEGADVLEIGGGVGAFQAELLRAGARGSVNIELSAGYEEAAARLAEEEGVAGQVQRRIGDFVAMQDGVEAADIVVMNRVVCCYPWMEQLVGAAAGKTRRYLAMTFPRRRWWVCSGLWLGNTLLSLRGCEFRSYVHPGVESAATRTGLVVRHADQSLIWQALVLERAA